MKYIITQNSHNFITRLTLTPRKFINIPVWSFNSKGNSLHTYIRIYVCTGACLVAQNIPVSVFCLEYMPHTLRESECCLSFIFAVSASVCVCVCVCGAYPMSTNASALYGVQTEIYVY